MPDRYMLGIYHSEFIPQIILCSSICSISLICFYLPVFTVSPVGVVRLVKRRLSLLEGQSFSFTFLVLLSLLLFCTFLTTLLYCSCSFSVCFIWMSFCIHSLYFVLSVGMRHFDKVTMYVMSESCIFFQSGMMLSLCFSLFLW